VIAFGRRAWQLIAPGHVPDGLADFETIEGAAGRRAPGTQHDAWLWISGSEPDIVWDRASAATRTVAHVARLAAEQPGFTYRNGRDITGFVDGTANPPTRLAGDVALVPEGEPGEGGSHVIAMRRPRSRRVQSLPRRPGTRLRADEAGQHRARLVRHRPPTSPAEIERGGVEEQIPSQRALRHRRRTRLTVAFSAD
jgi:hypothetical protein